MHDFEGGYATLFNKRHNRTGALFEGRFHPEPVESEGHSWEVSRYIHLNPVRAGIVDDPAKYAWSSYGYYLDPKGAPPWLDWRTVLADFAGTEAAARLAYCRYVQAGIRNPPRNPFEDLSRVDKSDRRSVIGDCSNADSSDLMSPTAAVAKCKPILTPEQELNRIVSAIAEQFGATVESIRSRGRHGNSAREAAIFVCRETLPSRLKVLAEYFGGVSLSAITESARRARQRMETDTTFRERIHRITD
jgi:hypothetical protein